MGRRAAAAALSVVAAACALVLSPPPAAAQAPSAPREGQCLDPSKDPEIYGPTDINAQSANQSMAVAVNRVGTVTVLRWPRPSFYDQVKEHTTDRNQPRFGARPNDGAFLGLALTTAHGTATSWLRDWPAHQRYAGDLTDTVVTDYARPELGLSVTVTDVVATGLDVLARRVEVRRAPGSPVQSAKLMAFENFSLVVTKHPGFPTQDWCQEEENVDQATYVPALDAIVHTKSGVDESTHQLSSVALALAFAGPSQAHQVGGDATEATSPDAALPGPTQDAYDDAADGTLSGNGSYTGQTTGALARDLDLSRGAASEVVLVAAGPDLAGAGASLGRARSTPFGGLTGAKEAWIAGLLAQAPWPATDDPAVSALARRALVTLVTDYDPRSGAIVASIATQSPYGEDWLRDGSFFNHALDLIGLGDWVRQRGELYASLQQRADQFHPDAFAVPFGNWAMNYYADGIVGGPIPWEIDETGYALWTLWDHFRAGGDGAYLRHVYPSVRAGADFLVSCRDPTSGLQCPASEDDHPNPTQSIVGAGPVWLGLTSAAKAADALGQAADAARWRARAADLGAAIDAHLFANGGYGGGDPVMAWPVCFRPYTDPQMASNLEAAWNGVAPSFAEPAAGRRLRGAYENKALVALAKAWKGDPARMARVRQGLAWIAGQAATPDTHTMGEVWLERNGRIEAAVSQPHVWEQVLFYLASLEAWPPASVADVGPSCGGVVEALEARRALARAAPGAPARGGTAPVVRQRPLPATGGSPLLPVAAAVTLAAGLLLRRRRA